MLKSALVVASFWWLVVSLWGYWSLSPHHTPSDWVLNALIQNTESATLQHWAVLCAIGFLGWAVTLLLALRQRQDLFMSLLPHEKNGLWSSLGPSSQFLLGEKCFTINRRHRQALTEVKADAAAGLDILAWIYGIQKNHPLHAKALLECLQILNQHPHFPADEDNPKSTLLMHSIQVALCAKELALGFDYQGIEDRHFKVPPRDLEYQFSPLDPMVALVTLCHDMGKLKTLTCDAKHRVIAVKGQHGVAGARALAKLDCIQLLPIQDQRTLYFALSFFASPALCTLNAQAQIHDDRSAALMMLLIEAHKKVDLMACT